MKNRPSPHTVAHRRSLAYRMFNKAADSRDMFLDREGKGDLSPTLQKYFTGISLKRYIALVCIEYPLIVISSFITWAVMPVGFLYMVVRIVDSVNDDSLSLFRALGFFFIFLLLTIVGIAVVFFIWSLILSWASSPPSPPVEIGKRLFHGRNDPDFDDFPEKFPGPIALFKKWLLSKGSGESSMITWDSGKKRAGW